MKRLPCCICISGFPLSIVASRLLDECLSLAALREIGLFDVCRKFLEFLKNIVYRVDEPQHTYGALGESAIVAERMPYLAGFQGMGEVICGGVFKHDQINHKEHSVMYGLLVVSLAHVFFDVRLEYLCSTKLFERLEFFAIKAKEAFDERADHQIGFFDDSTSFYVTETFEGSTNKKMNWNGTEVGTSGDPTTLSSVSPNINSFFGAEKGGDRKIYSDDDRAKLGPHTFTSILFWAAADRVARVASIFIRDPEKSYKAQRWVAIAHEMRKEIEEKAWNNERNCFCTYWNGSTVGPSLLRLVELGFLQEDDPRFASTLRAFEEDAFKIAVSPNTFTSNTLLWYAEALRVSGKATQARNLVNALMNAYNNAGSLSEAVDLRESKLWGNFPCAAAILSFMRVSVRLSKGWNTM